MTGQVKDGDEMEVRRGGRPGPGTHRPQRRKRRPCGLSRARRDQFLQALGESCNVCHAARIAGTSTTSIYDLRRRDPGFAAEWAQALEQGYAELEMQLLRQSIFGSETTETVLDSAEPGREKVKTLHSYPHATGLRLLLSHRAEVTAYRQSKAAAPPSGEDLREKILQELDAVGERSGKDGNAGGNAGS